MLNVLIANSVSSELAQALCNTILFPFHAMCVYVFRNEILGFIFHDIYLKATVTCSNLTFLFHSTKQIKGIYMVTYTTAWCTAQAPRVLCSMLVEVSRRRVKNNLWIVNTQTVCHPPKMYCAVSVPNACA